MHLAFNMVTIGGIITAGGGRSGVLGYAEKLAVELPIMYPNDVFTIFITADLFEILNKKLKNVTFFICDYASKSAMRRFLWEQFKLPLILKKLSVDLIYTFSATDILFSPCPSVIRIGNMLPYDKDAINFHFGFKAKLRLYYLRYITWISVKTSNAALIMSKPAAPILINENGYAKKKIRGINRGFSLKEIPHDTTIMKNLPAEYLLTVSHVYEYKRIGEIIDAYSIAKNKLESIPPLLIVGDLMSPQYTETLNKQIKSLFLQDSVIFTGAIHNAPLLKVIESAKITIFSSMVETYPSTLLEQMALGCAMIVSNRGVMPAFCGDAVLYYNPISPEDLADKIIIYLSSEETINNMKLKSLKKFRGLDTTWKTALEKRHALFEEITSSYDKRKLTN